MFCFGAEERAFGENYPKRELRYSGNMERKLTSEIVSIYVKNNLAKEFE